MLKICTMLRNYINSYTYLSKIRNYIDQMYIMDLANISDFIQGV